MRGDSLDNLFLTFHRDGRSASELAPLFDRSLPSLDDRGGMGTRERLPLPHHDRRLITARMEQQDDAHHRTNPNYRTKRVSSRKTRGATASGISGP